MKFSSDRCFQQLVVFTFFITPVLAVLTSFIFEYSNFTLKDNKTIYSVLTIVILVLIYLFSYEFKKHHEFIDYFGGLTLVLLYSFLQAIGFVVYQSLFYVISSKIPLPNLVLERSIGVLSAYAASICVSLAVQKYQNKRGSSQEEC
jgi:hypothetical protein